MKHGVFALILVSALALTTAVFAEDYSLGALTVSHPWARASAGKAKNGAAYVVIANRGQDVDRLLKIASPVAKKAEVHTSIMKDGIMMMRPVKAVEVNPGEPTVMKPGALHIMLMGLETPLKEGRTFPMTLTFEKAGSIEIQVKVGKVGAMKHGEHRGTGHGAGGTS
jgi:hypothetical protein